MHEGTIKVRQHAGGYLKQITTWNAKSSLIQTENNGAGLRLKEWQAMMAPGCCNAQEEDWEERR